MSYVTGIPYQQRLQSILFFVRAPSSSMNLTWSLNFLTVHKSVTDKPKVQSMKWTQLIQRPKEDAVRWSIWLCWEKMGIPSSPPHQFTARRAFRAPSASIQRECHILHMWVTPIISALPGTWAESRREAQILRNAQTSADGSALQNCASTHSGEKEHSLPTTSGQSCDPRTPLTLMPLAAAHFPRGWPALTWVALTVWWAWTLMNSLLTNLKDT